MSVVYFAECDGLVKIGFTKNLSQRFASMRTGNPKPMTVFATIEGGRSLEKKIHDELASFRERNEWFRDCAEVRAAATKFAERAAKQAAAFSALNEAADRAPLNTIVPTCLADVDERFHRLLHLPIIDDLVEAMDLEKIRGLPNGSLMDSVVRGEERRVQFRLATDLLMEAHEKYGALIEDAYRRMPDADFSPRRLYAAAGAIVSRAEQIHHQFIAEMEARQREGGGDHD